MNGHVLSKWTRYYNEDTNVCLSNYITLAYNVNYAVSEDIIVVSLMHVIKMFRQLLKQRKMVHSNELKV